MKKLNIADEGNILDRLISIEVEDNEVYGIEGPIDLTFLMKMYKENGFPVTIVRPSHTYDERSIPVGVHGDNGSWQTIRGHSCAR